MAQKTTTDLRQEIELFFFKEARLLDDRQWRPWFELFTDDAIYWVPANRDDIDPKREVSIIYDDHNRLEERVWRLESGLAYSQELPSRTQRLVSNVEILEEDGDEITAVCNVVIYELQFREQRTYPGRCKYRLRRVDGRWMIAMKKVNLLANGEYLTNMTFLI